MNVTPHNLSKSFETEINVIIWLVNNLVYLESKLKDAKHVCICVWAKYVYNQIMSCKTFDG